ncbi:unnamed protein product [Parnassius apollo]|uniref:(apollo) hypothetical protein n=1 Tax=Parnassius apollo TaxID=110799 RepID=A0A8S3WVP5_PARAO|nr:unnamed protein product [Parnassius apollo]
MLGGGNPADLHGRQNRDVINRCRLGNNIDISGLKIRMEYILAIAVMSTKDLRTDSALGAHINNDGSTKYPQSQSGNALQNNAIKACPDIGTNPLVKVDVQTSRPCAIIGPDRVLPSPTSNDGFIKKVPVEWPCSNNMYCQPPEHSQKISEYQPTRNISPRQTFQENMQRIMVSPYSSMKMNDDTNFAPDKSVTMLKKLNIPLDGKFCDVPYTVNHPCNEQKSARVIDMPASNTNSGMTRSVPHGWPTTNVRPLRPYGVSDLYQYSNYPSCAGPRSMPMPIIRPHQTGHDEPGRMYPERYYQEANVRFRPYPPSKERYPHGRYDYINNYSNTLHPPPPFPPHTFDSQKSIPTHSYPLYPQVPLKYIDRRMGEPIMDGFQRTTTQAPNLNITYRGPIIHPSYGTLPANCIQNNMFPYPSDTSPKSGASNKLPYIVDYETHQNKNDVSRTHSMKSELVYSNYPSHNMQSIPQHSFYRKENLPSKNFEYMPHFRNLDQFGNFHNPLLRHSVHFSPNAVAMSPSDSNTSNDTQIHSATQEDCGYVSQSSTTSVRSVDSHTSGIPIEHQTFQSSHYGYGFLPRNLQMQIPKNSKNSKTKKDLDVRQFLQMWNEGDDETSEQNKDENILKDSNNLNNIPSHYETANKQEQLYVLGLVNVPSEELGKYDHIQKISKLPENIKGYNSIELLNQFEEVIESSNIRNFNLNSRREYDTPIKSAMSRQMVNESRPISPLDVEAKISQSVIHKEVGCNFEIKPCSPKMLNVEIATPIQSLLDERVIEKVSNPIVTKPALLQKANTVENRNFPNSPNYENSSKEVTNVSSCTMENVKYANDNCTVASKENYSLQDLEYNSSVCLASLPRLDNDIELNFPEINQQFMNANKIESAITLPSVKDLPMLDTEQVDRKFYKEKIGHERQISSKTESDKEVTKLSKYRKLKKTDFEQKESHNQTNTFVKMQFRTDSVIIKNPDKKKDQDGPSSIDNVENIDKNYLCEQAPQVNNNEGQNSNILEDTAIDFSLHKNDTDSIKECHIEQNTVSESLLNIIDEDLNIPEAYETSEFQIIQNNDKSNDINENVKPGKLSDSYTSAELFNELSKETSKTSYENVHSESNTTKTIREGFCEVISSEHKLCYNTGINTINTCDSMFNSAQTNDKEYHLLPNITCGIEEASQHSLSTISSESPHIDKVLEINTNTIICEGSHNENDLTHELKIKVCDQKEFNNELCNKEMNKNITNSPEDSQSMSDITCMNNDHSQNADLRVQTIQNKSEHTSKTNIKSLDVKNITGKRISDNKGNAGKTKNNFRFKKRLCSASVQNLILFSEGICLKENDFKNQCENLSINSTITLSLQKGNMNNLNLEKSSPQTENVCVENHVNMDIVNMNTKIGMNGNVSDNVSEVDISTNLLNEQFNCKNKENCRENNHENPQNFGNSSNNNVSCKDEKVDSVQSELKHGVCYLKNSADINVVCNTISKNDQICEDTKLLSSEINCNNIEKKGSDMLEKEFLNEHKQVFTNNQIRLKRSLSDSAINIYSSDDQKNENIDNMYVIPKKRKKINPCELMEPNLIAENLCNIIQTNRRNSISTLYNEKNVSFCILIDNSCVLTGESEESQKICLAEICEDACDDGELKDNSTFTSESVIFADEISVREDFNTNTKINEKFDTLSNGFLPHCTEDERTEEKIFGDTWIEDVACIETVFSDDIAEDVVLDAPLSPNDNDVFECEDIKNESLLYSDHNHLDKIKRIYGNEMCNDDAELVETLYRTPQMDVKKTLVRRESQYLDESSRYYDNDSLEKILSESNDKDQLIPGAECSRLKTDILCSDTNTQDDKENLEFELPPSSTESYKNTLIDPDNDDNSHKSSGNNDHEPTQYDIVHSCESSCGNNAISYQQKIESPRYSNSSSPEVSSTTSEEKSCGILLKITNCNGSISSQINDFDTKNKRKYSCKFSENKDLKNYTNNISNKRPLITKAAQKYIPPLKETIRDLKVKLPLPQHSLNKLKILKITKEKPKLDKCHNNNHNLFKPHFPKKNKPKFEDVLKSIDEIQIKMHREKNKKQKHSIPKVVIKKNENGAHYASTSNDDTFSPDLTGRKWQPWVFIEKNYFIDKMALNKKVKAVFSHRKKTFVLAEKFRKYKSVSDSKFVISHQPKTEDISSGKLKYTIRLKQKY